MKIAIMGTGGMGAYYGGLLANNGQDVHFISRGEHLKAMRQNGLQIKSIHGDLAVIPVKATDNPSEIGLVDLVLFCTKTYHTEEAAKAIQPVVGPQTTVVSLQNGIDAAERIGKVVGMEHLLAGATWISSFVELPGVIKQVSTFRRVVLGELDGSTSSRLQSVYEAFKPTGITIETSDNILKVLWTKFVFIAAVSSFGSLTRLPMGDYRSVPETREKILSLMREVRALAEVVGVSLDKDVVEKSIKFIDDNLPHIKPSMQVDVENGRRTEIESMIGVIGRKGREKGIPTPVADMVYASLLPVELKAVAALSAH
jgi:2-dehydropantoate 2-reductase